MTVRGILRTAGYVPYRRLDRSEINDFFGSGTSTGQRSVAAHDEDTVTMGFEAARSLLSGQDNLQPNSIWFSTTDPPYMEKRTQMLFTPPCNCLKKLKHLILGVV